MGFSVTFWGVRGTVPCPIPSYMGYGGNTSCVEVTAGDRRIVIDAGTGIRALGKHWLKAGVTEATLLLSHTHLDHISGFPFFAPAYTKGFGLRVISGHLADGPDIESVMARQMERPLFPVPMRTMGSELSFTEIEVGNSFPLDGGVMVRTAPLNHPDGATAYRIEYAGRSLCYVTDTEHPATGRDPGVLALVRGADLLIYDSTYSDAEYPARVGWGHSTWQECVRLAEEAGVGRAVIFHHDPSRTDAQLDAIAAAAEAMRPGTLVAREGMVLTP